MNRFVFISTLFSTLLSSLSTAMASELKSDENIQFFPSAARVTADGNIEAAVDGWVYENENRPGMNSLLARYLGIDLDAMSESERRVFTERTQLFRVDAQRGKKLRIYFDAGTEIALAKTTATGRTNTRASLPGLSPSTMQAQWLNYRARLPIIDARMIQGRLLLVPATGISVVSDIDDTIKISNVLDRKVLLMNTFVKPFVSVPGMAERYQALAQKSGSTFHYVSGSPHHLYPALASFLRDAKFPEGTMHLRDLNWRKELFGRESGSEQHKLSSIRQLLRDFPQRQFMLFGDSGERDPEIYGQLAREFPKQIIEIHIRDVTQQTRSDARYIAAFKDVPDSYWFLSAAEVGK